MSKRVLIIGAGPAGLTAALEFVRRSDAKPIVLESLDDYHGKIKYFYHGDVSVGVNVDAK